eukprot:9796988-Lingulodinium_polyedra.AAC.1
MEIDSMHKGKGHKGEGGQYSKGGGQSALCPHCGKKGAHQAKDCWFNPGNNKPEAVAKRAAA